MKDAPSPTSGSITRQLLAAEILRLRAALDHHTRAIDALDQAAVPHRVALEEAARLEEEARA